MRLFEIRGELEVLLAQAIDVETGEVKDEHALELFETLEVERDHKIASIAVMIKELEAEVDKIASVMFRLRARLVALENQAASWRRYIGEHSPVGTRVADPRVQVQVREGAFCVGELVDLDRLPPQFVIHEKRADVAALLAALKQGSVIGAVLSRGKPIVTIR